MNHTCIFFYSSCNFSHVIPDIDFVIDYVTKYLYAESFFIIIANETTFFNSHNNSAFSSITCSLSYFNETYVPSGLYSHPIAYF